MDMVKYRKAFRITMTHKYIDTNAAYAGKWLSNFVSSTLYKNPDFYKNTLILITFDEVTQKPSGFLW